MRLLLLITIPIQSVSASPEDTTPPSAVTDLTVSESGRNYVVLTWTAPGDDGNIGTASKYDIRYSTSPIAEGNWDDAIQCEGEPIPKPPGSSETFKITGLARGTTYYFALKTADEVPNWSPLSRVVSGGYGAVVGEYNGVTAYSNGDNNYYSWDYNTVDSYNSGMKWQCVEYVNRYYYLIYGSQIRIPGTNAIDYYDTASERGLVAYSNGGTTPPQLGDILCSGGGSYGHVAIVRGVTSNSVHVIHQNWTNTKDDNDKSVGMAVSDGHYTLDGFSSSYPVQGWLRRSPEATIQDQSIYPNTASPGDILTFVYNINNPTSNAISNVRLGARIRKSEPPGSWIDDPSRDKVVTLQPGAHDYSRDFQIPDSVDIGLYDGQWVILHRDTGLWIDSKEMSQILQVTTAPPSGRVAVDVDTKYWEDGLYQLRITAQATPGDVSSITISGPHIDTATVQTGGGDPHHLYDDGKHHDGAANDGEWWVLLNIKEVPVIGETVTFHIKYNDSSSEIISKTIDGLVTETATLLSPPDGSTVNTLTPTFEWRNPSISGLTYSVQIDDTDHNRIYEVYDLPDSTTSHTIDRPLNSGVTYYWLISASDSNGNEALTLWDTLRVSSLAGLGYDKVTQVTDTINQGAEAIFNYIISQTKDLIFALGWEGSTLKLSVYKPDGSLYREEENSTSPITISAPKAETGEWRYKITGIDVPYDDYPFVAEIGERPPVASDLQNLIVYPNPCRLTDGNPTITFKGLTVDATIRIVGIDGQLVNQTELIGQVNWTWNLRNQTDEGLSRGIYIYLITNTAGEKKVGKIAIMK